MFAYHTCRWVDELMLEACVCVFCCRASLPTDADAARGPGDGVQDSRFDRNSKVSFVSCGEQVSLPKTSDTTSPIYADTLTPKNHPN